MRPPYLLAVVEDDLGLRTDLLEFLQLRGLAARGFESAEAFFQVWPAVHFDLLLLDLVLPGANGLEVAKRVRAQDTSGIIMLTSWDSSDEHVLGLNAGADVFLSKRSSLEVIEAACLSVLRRLDRQNTDRPETHGGAWRLDARQWRLEAPNGTFVELTHSEVLILSALFENPSRAIPREALLQRLGKQETLSSLRNLDNAASRLRRKVLEACGSELPVRPSYGKGYTFAGRCEVST